MFHSEWKALGISVHAGMRAESPWWLRKVNVKIPGPGAVTLGTFMHITCVFEILCPGNIREVVFKMCVVPCGGGLI